MMPLHINSSQPGQMRPQGCYCQGYGNYPHHVDASSHASCEHWPTPSPCYGSCVHGNFPAYTPYWPPCYPPQAPYHTCSANHSGFHPRFPLSYIHQPFPVGYQPGYYESEKDATGKHQCTKCSPQMCYPKSDSSVVIEEHEPEIDKGDRGEVLNHVRSTNCPYPIIWIPHENPRNQEHVSHDQPPAKIKAPGGTNVQKGDPKSWNGCFPFDENAIKSLMQNQDMKKMPNGKTVELPFDMSKLKSFFRGQEGKEVQIHKNREPGQLQYPIFLVPSHGKQEDAEASERREDSNKRSNLNSFPSDHINEGQVPQGNKGNFEGNVLSDAEEKSLKRNIPVENHQQEPRNIPVKLLENHHPEPTKRTGKAEPVEDTQKEQRKSPPKASRLPPVCLRVDPLPKRKNGCSKSLSPPRRKEQSLTSEETNDVYPLSSKEAETRSSPEACNVKCEEANKEKKTSEGSPNPTGTRKESVETKSNLQGVNWEIVKPCEAKENREKPAKKTFAEEEAARIIQSRFRGYDVRRWEPIKKLKEIATVRVQIGDVKKRIQALQLSADQHTEGKEIVVLGEMVMNLLLKLDSVQGLHPSIRGYRKSLAKELSGMQESIDSLKTSSEEKEAVEEQAEITSQTGDGPVNLELSQLAEGNKMVSDSNTEKVCPASLEEHLTSRKNATDGQMVAEAEEVTGSSETLATDPEAASETGISQEATTIPETIEAVETVLPINLSSADGNEMTVKNIKEDEVMVEKLEEPLPELPRVVETTRGPGFEGPENATEVSETVANASENEDRKGDDDSVLPSEKDVVFPELPGGVVDDEMQLLSQGSLSCAPETVSKEEVNVDYSGDHSNGIGQETEVAEHVMPEETKKLMEENQRFKETMEMLVKAGKEQLEVISKLTGRVKSLEKKLSQKKRTHIGRRKPDRGRQATKPMPAS